MTANELADELEGSISILTIEEYYDYANNIELAQTMLRQQAQEIDGLRSKTNTNIDERTANGDKRLINLLYQKIELQQAEIELLKKELALQRLSDISQEIENEPVAWMFEYGTDRGDATNPISWYTNIKFEKPYLNGLIRNIEPLYTHPMRELTDEEINKLWVESHEDGIAMQQGFTTQQHYFAHLILKKAREK